MKRFCLLLTLSALTGHAAFAQDAPASAPAPAPAPTPAPAAATPPAAHAPATRPPPPPPLTKEENAEISKAYADALKADPKLATEAQAIKDKQKALQDEQKAYQQKVLTALQQADPNLAGIIATHPNLHPNPPPAPKKEAPPKEAKAPKPPKPAKTPKPAPAASTNAAPAAPTAPTTN